MQFLTIDEVKPITEKPLPYFPTPDEIWDPELYEELQPLHEL